MNLKIESNIPIPQSRTTTGVRATIEKMKVSDSVVVDTYSQASYISTTIRKTGYVAVTRKLDNGKVRVWKTTKTTKKK